jgi:hypothetical protein
VRAENNVGLDHAILADHTLLANDSIGMNTRSWSDNRGRGNGHSLV